MSLSIGIVGLPNVGKSTLFNTLTKNKVEASNYPFCTIDPNVGVVKVPDKRLDELTRVSASAKTIPTVIEFKDIAGLVRGASEGEGLGNKFLAHIRECDAICEVVRDFEDGNIIHVEGSVDPKRDRETINLELVMADLESVTKQLDKAIRDAKGKDKDAVKKKDLLAKIKEHLDSGRAARELEFDEENAEIVKSFNLLTIKPILYVVNSDDLEKQNDSAWDGEVIRLNIKQEEEIAGLSEEEQKEFIRELGLKESGLEKLIKASYSLLNLITFLTSGPEESRAWTVRKGAKAPEAAGVIHTDFIKGFVRAEVIEWDKFVELGGWAKAKEKGLVRTEGKDYEVKDGDTCFFLINK